jgi:hypothetical protein
VVDQFEEIFRFRQAKEPAKDSPAGSDAVRATNKRLDWQQQEAIRSEADAFVALLLETVGGPERTRSSRSISS